MAQQRQHHEHDAVVAAINRVLKTERDGIEALRRAEQEARRRQAEARTQATAIARRTDTCITRLHIAYLQKIDAKTAALTGADAPASSGRSYDRASLEEAARRVAAKLTEQP